MSTADHYRLRSPEYGMGHTRRDRIVGLIPASSRRVLDIGCGNGALGALLKQHGRWVGGVELSEHAVGTAAQRLDRVWSFDIQGKWPPEVLGEPFDTIIFAEILEHVFDPVAVLREAKRALAPDGSVVITIPNFLTWTNRIRFLFGSFSYRQQGMFDFGHIRWFTYRYLKEVLAEAGFTIREEHHIIFPGKLTSVLKRWPSLFAWQFVVRATTI